MTDCTCLRCGQCIATAYEATCILLTVQPDPSVWTSLLCQSNELEASFESNSTHLLALFKVVFSHEVPLPASVSIGNEACPSRIANGDWICSLLKFNSHSMAGIVNLNLSSLGLTGIGMRKLSDCSARLPNIKFMHLKFNSLAVGSGARYVASFVLQCSKTLSVLDVSYNGLSSNDVLCIRMAAECVSVTRVIAEENCYRDSWRSFAAEDEDLSILDSHQKSTPILTLIVLGNFPSVEMWNAISHGVGVILSILGTCDLLLLTDDMPRSVQVACVIYGLSGLILFTASTLYHSFFLLTTAKKVFKIIDHCAVFILIAGSYTPICAILYAANPAPIVDSNY